VYGVSICFPHFFHREFQENTHLAIDEDHKDTSFAQVKRPMFFSNTHSVNMTKIGQKDQAQKQSQEGKMTKCKSYSHFDCCFSVSDVEILASQALIQQRKS
jgi:hypothetical protein